MSTLFALALAASSAVTGPTLPSCSWDRPGVNPFMGNVVAAVDRYQDIPAEVRARLKARMSKRQYDEIATISRDGVTGKHRYAPDITDMHFGQGTICRTVTRSKWPEKTVERGLVYCESGHCIIVPTVCRNVSRVQRLEDKRAAADSAEAKDPQAAAAAGAGGGTAGTNAEALAQNSAAQPTGELEFEAPAAGGASFQDVAQGRTVPGATGTPSSPPPATAGGGGLVALAPLSFAPFYGGGGGGGVIGAARSTPADPGGPLLPGSETTPRPVVVPPADPPFPMPPGPPIGTPNLAVPVTAVPEPGTWLLMALGLAALAAAARRRR
jgi:hypothetical protein